MPQRDGVEGTVDRLNEAPQAFYSSFLTCTSMRLVRRRTDKIESNERKRTVEFECRSLEEAQELHRWFVGLRELRDGQPG